VEQQNLEHWFLDKQGKLLAWREWRATLTELDNTELYSKVAVWWKFVPLVSKKFDPWRQETWPNPWELVGDGSFCPNAQGLGIFYTLALLGKDCELMLAIVDKEPRLMALLPNKQLLNYYVGEVVDIDNVEMQILKTWAPSDLARLVKV